MPLGLDQELLRQLMETFAIELEEQIQLITDGLLMLEKGAQEDARQHILDGVFRAAHNIKGAARGVGLTDISDISHHLESMFAILKRQNANPDGAVTDLALESLDAMRQAMVAQNENTPLAFDKASLLVRLEAKVAGDAVPEATSPIALPAVSPIAEVAPVEPVPIPAATPTSLAPAAVVMEQEKPVEAQTVTVSDVVRVNLEKLEKLAAQIEELQVTKIEMEDHLASMQSLKTLVHEMVTSWRRSGIRSTNLASSTLHELEGFLQRNTDAITELDAYAVAMHRDMRSSTNRLGILVETLQDDVRMMRLVPVATLLRPMTRSVRDIARELGKKVDFELRGDEIEVDRVVLEGMRDPLVHLLRNALDHGIETPAHRQSKGKPAEGSLRVEVRGEGGQVVIIVQDDGDGISAEKIARTASKKKIATDTELAAMSRDEILGLIFRPGFSSKDIITSISGRGVGLDVVVANLRSLKGTVQVETEEGKGTRFILRLPVTLASDHGVLVKAGGALFAIPTTSVDRIMEISPAEVIEVEASHAILHHGRAIPLRDLAAALELTGGERLDKGRLPVVVVSKGWDSVAFLVDEVLGEREMVVKPFRPPLVAVRNVTGGTLTGSGDVIMVLNSADLVDSALKSSLARLPMAGIRTEAMVAPRVLVVDDSITTRTLEKSILEHAGYQVSVAVDGRQAWNLLQEQMFDLVISDVEMPEMDGFQLAEHIKQSERLRDMPVIIVTSLANEADRRRGIEVGADAYIVKGQFETKALLDVVSQLI